MFDQIKEDLGQVKTLEKIFLLGKDKKKRFSIGKIFIMFLTILKQRK